MLHEIFVKVKIAIREFLNPIFGKRRRKGLNEAFTIISNNCWAGHVYRYFNLPYSSPTIGLYFYADEYLRFVINLKEYLNHELKFINYTESKYKEDIIRHHYQNVPIGLLGDVEIMFLHYKSKEEAAEKWNRRKERIQWDNLFFKMSEQNLCNPEILKKFDSLPAENKICFVTKDYKLDCQILFMDYLGKDEISNDTVNFRKFIDVKKWLR